MVWVTFCEAPAAVPMSVVRKFYANAKADKNGFTMVRGLKVEYSVEAIRTGDYVDLGYVIYQGILRFLRGSTTVSIPYASIVTKLWWYGRKPDPKGQGYSHDHFPGGSPAPQGYASEAEPVDLPGIDLWEGYVNIGPPTSTCVKCGARMWNMERNNKSNKNNSPTFSLCCKMDGGGKIDHKINNGGAPYCFKVKGQNLHFLGSILSADVESPKFYQVYIYDTENELENMMNLMGGCRDEIDESIVEALMYMLYQHNELVRQFHTARERFKDNEHDEFRLVLLSSQSVSGRPNIIGPTYEVEGLILQYPLLFPHADEGFHTKIPLNKTKVSKSADINPDDNDFDKKHREYVSMKEYYCYKLMIRLSEEFQKHGLLHMHMLIWPHPDVRSKIVSQIDALVSVEILDKDTNHIGYAAVSNYMIHGPCRVVNTYSPCMVKGRCMRHFPKRFNGNTYIDDCGFPIYRRRNTGRNVKKKGVFWIIGHDTATMVLKKNKSTPDSSISKKKPCLNEVKQYLDGRYVCASEAAWRIFGFDVHSQWPSVNRLPIHLPGNKYVSFRTSTTLSEVVQEADSKKTKLEAWFETNKEFPTARDFTYAEFPTHFTWLPRDYKWRAPQRGDVVGRLPEVHAAGGDLLYLRLLLMRRKGATSFEELRRVEGHVFESFKEACATMELFQNDSQWYGAMVKNSHSSLAKQLREMFVKILAYCSISDPPYL
ncbi:uncharacterized protein LOC141719090 [Apium graveolens]|uniref:uncharacterized protein LOC141719090 n=1 Tax=Apium graveolens TaxID=4045 RepID=UPI003D78F589